MNSEPLPSRTSVIWERSSDRMASTGYTSALKTENKNLPHERRTSRAFKMLASAWQLSSIIFLVKPYRGHANWRCSPLS